jgi:hypothetical protein
MYKNYVLGAGLKLRELKITEGELNNKRSTFLIVLKLIDLKGKRLIF